jgi:hypothetical protein
MTATTTGLTRRGFALAAPALLAACSPGGGGAGYDEAVTRIWRHGPLKGLEGAALSRELVRYATLAPSSHNTQCWRFAIEGDAITILPDLARRCRAVDPDDHHLFVSLGCAAENLLLAARAHGLIGEPSFDAGRDAVRIALQPAAPRATPLFQAIAERQSTRAEYDGKPLAAEELQQLEAAATSERVRLLMFTHPGAIERVLDPVVQGNTAQMADPAFVAELKTWLRFSGADAVRLGDGLYSAASGHPSLPAWLGERLFDLFFTPKAENDKVARQLRSSAGVAVFVARRDDKEHWVEVGRAYERFALQATALGVRNAMVNQPVEVAPLRPKFADLIGVSGSRPDLVVRFGRGPKLPRSLRRPLDAVLV